MKILTNEKYTKSDLNQCFWTTVCQADCIRGRAGKLFKRNLGFHENNDEDDGVNGGDDV